MKKFFLILLAGLVVLAVTAPAFAWEFELKGEYEYRLRYFSRTGGTDLFGVASIQDTGGAASLASLNNAPFYPPRVGFAGPNFYGNGIGVSTAAAAFTGGTTGAAASTGTGVRIVRGGFSQYGSDAFYSDSRLTFEPSIRVNPAIRLHGVYTIGGYRNKYLQTAAGSGIPPFERYSMSQVSDNAYDTAAIGSWEQFRATIQMPYGIISIGVKDFPLGTGATLAYNTRAEALLFVLPYGPIRMLPALWLARGVSTTGSATLPDGETKPNVFMGCFLTYDQGPLNFGGGWVWRQFHSDARLAPNSSVGTTVPALNTTGLPGTGGFDQNLLFWQLFMKYNNGRFAMAAEYAWATIDQYHLGRNPALFPVPAAIPGGAFATNLHQEGYHLLLELAAAAGPTKVRLAWFQASGPVLNNGNPTKAPIGFAINYQALQPYEFLMFNTYGGGNNAFASTFGGNDGHGMLSDGYAFAARADYAVASNLNIYGSYIWAHRLETYGTLAGGVDSLGRPATGTAGAPLYAATDPRSMWLPGDAVLWKTLNGFGPGANPYVDNGLIGWEANAGVEWKLLEGLNMFLRYSYWQPGDWFNQAYQAVGFRTGNPVGDAMVLARDAIHAFQGSFMINF